MRVRESGMPEESYWESLLDVELILDRLGIDSTVGDVVELGCGYGTFTVPVARRITGRLSAYDMDPAMLARTQERVRAAGLANVACEPRDVTLEGYGLAQDSVDGCLLFNILHGEHPVELLRQSAEIVRPGGHVWAIHWRYDPATPRGPSMDIRPQPQQIAAWAEQTQLLRCDGALLDLPPWHYGWRLRRV